MILPQRRGRGGGGDKVNKFRLRPYLPMVVNKPYRAVSKSGFGKWRDDINDAMSDAKGMPMPCRVVSSNGVVLARFESGLRAAEAVGK